MSAAELPELPAQKTTDLVVVGDHHQSAVEVRGNIVHLRDVSVAHAEAAAVLRAALRDGGDEAALDLIRRALPVGLVAVSLTAAANAAVDTGAVERTLTAFQEGLQARSTAAVEALDAAVAQLSSADTQLAGVAAQALNQLPAQLERLLAGEAVGVREAVRDAASAVQSAGLADLRSALSQHSELVRAVLTDQNGPLSGLRRDVLTQLDTTRRELLDQVTGVRGLLAAIEAGRAATTTRRTTRAAGAEWESHVNALVNEIASGAGDYYTSTGDTPAAGGTRRNGDGVVTLGARPGHGEVRIVVEAKTRAKPMTAAAWARELAQSMQLRQAAAAIALVPDSSQLPAGAHLFCRVAPNAYVVVADDGGTAARLVYMTVKEVILLTMAAAHRGSEINRETVGALITQAVDSLTGFDEMAKHVNTARASLEKSLQHGLASRKGIHENLTRALAALNPH
ncbi:MAG: hypothetical protein ACTHK1_14640 [Actinomycetales bacterium]